MRIPCYNASNRRVAKTKRLGFTLAELLVAIAILGILAAITFPVFRAAVDAAKRTVCINNYSQIGKALLLYQGDYDDRVPPVNYKDVDFTNPGDDRTWVQTLLPYAGDFRLFRCPADTGRGRDVPISSGPPGSVWQDYYRASLRSNLGYNYLYFSPLVRLTNGEWHAFPIESSAVADKGRTIVFIDSLWDRTNSGVPFGGGSWVVGDDPKFDSPSTLARARCRRAMSFDSPIPLRTAPLSLLQRLALLYGHLKHVIKRAADDQELRFQYRLPTR